MFQSLKNRVTQISVVAVGMIASSPAMAALSAEEEAVFTTITTKITDLGASGLGVLALFLGIMIGFKLLKRVANKVT